METKCKYKDNPQPDFLSIFLIFSSLSVQYDGCNLNLSYLFEEWLWLFQMILYSVPVIRLIFQAVDVNFNIVIPYSSLF